MRVPVHRLLLSVIGVGITTVGFGANDEPVAPDASPEARALLKLLYDISGRYTFTGQHNYPNTKDHNSRFAAQYLGRIPVIFGTDMGHAKAGDSDSYLARPDIVQTCIREHQAGAIIALCWHAVPPTADEPITFRPLPGADPKHLKSVQGRLLDQQFHDVLTPGTALHLKWEAQVDVIAGYLAQLRDAHVPVLWRPYHEMNGDWFWWGGRGADTAALYRQMFDRFTKVHHLNNLIWVWSMDRMSRPGMEYDPYFPGLDAVDVLALDVYGGDFAPKYYEALERLARGKPLALAEVGTPPSPAILGQQPKWTYYMTWAGMVRNTSRQTYEALFKDPRVINRSDAVYARITAEYRRECGLAPLRAEPPDFSGHWLIDEDASRFGRGGASSAPAELKVDQTGNGLVIRTTRVVEYAENQITEEKLTIGGAPTRSEFMHTPRETTVRRTDDGALVFDSVMSPPWLPAGARLTTTDTWTLGKDGRRLTIESESKSRLGEQRVNLVFNRSF